MESVEICRLTEQAVARLLSRRVPRRPDRRVTGGRRRMTRWPFPGTVELWIPEADGSERYLLATSLNLSLQGVGIRCDEPLRPGLEVGVAIHEPEASFHGHALVRHCTEVENEYLVGLEFLYEGDVS